MELTHQLLLDQPVPRRAVTAIPSEKRTAAIKREARQLSADEVPGLNKSQIKQVNKLLTETINALANEARKLAEEEVKDKLTEALRLGKKAKEEKSYWEDKNKSKPILTLPEYRAIMQRCHPDKGGSTLAFQAAKKLEPYVAR